MPFALAIIGITLIVAATRNTQDQLFTLVKGDFSGSQSYLYWLVLILIVGSLGYIDKLKPISTSFMILLVVVLFLSKGDVGFFPKFNKAISDAASGQPVNTVSGTSINQINLAPLPTIPNFGFSLGS